MESPEKTRSRKAQDGFGWRSNSHLPRGVNDQKKQMITFYYLTYFYNSLMYPKETILDLHLYSSSLILPFSAHLYPLIQLRVHVIVYHYDLSLENILSLVPPCLLFFWQNPHSE